MRRRRSLVPVVTAAVVLLLGAATLLAVTSARPGTDVLGWLDGQAGGSGAAPGASGAPLGSVGAATSAANPGTSVPGSPPGISAAVASASGGNPPGPPASTSAEPSVPAASITVTASAAPTPIPAASATVAAAKPVYHGSRAKKVVALTFDDGYNPTALRQLLAILKREKVVATFFPYGWAVDKDPAGWHKVVEAGYPIGNHTLTHATLTTLTPEAVTSELTRGRRTIDLYIGGTSIDLMRPPGGAFNAVTARAIAAAGYPTMVLWDVDTFDWQGPSASTIRARAIRGTNGSIVLMHAGPLNTPKALPGIIANYRARGFTFVTVPELLAAR